MLENAAIHQIRIASIKIFLGSPVELRKSLSKPFLVSGLVFLPYHVEIPRAFKILCQRSLDFEHAVQAAIKINGELR